MAKHISVSSIWSILGKEQILGCNQKNESLRPELLISS